MGFRPRQLSDPPRSSEGNTLPLEDQYQKEFYRCLFDLVDGHLVISPEYITGGSAGSGRIDFLIARKQWGLELLRDRDHLKEHMDRFDTDGQYYSMIESGEMEKYIVLDFTVTRPRITRPGNTPLPLP
jgi:hypothetical protein